MSGKGGGGNNGAGKATGGILGIPPASKKMVQSLKEVVKNHSEQEIYATLKDCNMDPNEAVSRLLSQDPFHEVKSKKEKKKESKDTGDFRSRSANNTSYTTNRSSRGGGDRHVGRGASAQYNASEPAPLHGKPAYKRENDVHAYAGPPSTAYGVVGNNLNRRPSSYSDSVVPENKMSSVGLGDGNLSSSQPSSGYQSAWSGVPGQVSLADIVKMGRPQNKVSTTPNPPHHSVNNRHPVAPPAVSHSHLQSLEDYDTKISEVKVLEIKPSQDKTSNDEWPPIDNPSAANVSSILEEPADSELYANSSNYPVDNAKQHMNPQIEEAEALKDDYVETHDENHAGPASGRNVQEDNSGGSSLFDSNLYDSVNSYQPRKHAFERNEDVNFNRIMRRTRLSPCCKFATEDGISSVASNLQQLNLQNDDHGAAPEEDNPSVIIPNHLQVHTPDFSHLSFGSFGAAFSGPFSSRPLKSNLDETSEAADASSMGHSDNRNSEYYGDGHLENDTEGNIATRNDLNAGNYEASSDSRQEVLAQETPEVVQENQYSFPSSANVYNYENMQQLNPAFAHSQTTSQIQNLAPFSSVMQAYTNSLPNTLLASSAQYARESDLQYSAFPVAQSSNTKFSGTASANTGPTISMPETLRAGTLPTQQATQQALPGSGVAAGPAVPQHLAAMHPYSQPTLPLGHFANMVGYPFLPQSYAYMPSAFQQAFAGSSSYPQSLAAMLPQYKNNASVTSLPQPAAIPPGYGLGSSTNISGGNFSLNPPTAHAGTTVGYDDVLSSQFKDNNHLMSVQQAQNDNSAMWVHGPGSRTMSGVPASNYYSFQGQNQQVAGGYRQNQQPSQQQQQFGGHGYPNFYQQTGMSLDHQQQNPRDVSLSASQMQQSKQTQQLWQNGY